MGLKCARSIGVVEQRGMVADLVRCEKEARGQREPSFPPYPWSQMNGFPVFSQARAQAPSLA
jgi:hypothetical protein